jgi:hypothetical protein
MAMKLLANWSDTADKLAACVGSAFSETFCVSVIVTVVKDLPGRCLTLKNQVERLQISFGKERVEGRNCDECFSLSI